MRAVWLLIACLLAAQPGARADQVRDERWKQDLTYLSTELPARHANLFFVLPRAEFNGAVSDLMQRIPSLTDAEIMTGMARIVAMAGDAHTSISLTQARTGFRALPLSLYWFEDGLYVRSAASRYHEALGKRVVQIGARPVEEAYGLVSAVISHENGFWLRQKSPGYLILPDVLRALKIIPKDAPVQFTFEGAAGDRFSLELDDSPATDWLTLPDRSGFRPLASRDPSTAYWFTYLDDSRTLYFKYNRCAEMPGQPFAAFASNLFATLDSNPVDRLIVDLRDNPGGNSAVLDPFVQGLKARQGRYPTRRVYILLNRGTFSSAMLNAWSLQSARDQAVARGVRQEEAGILMGEPTGGNPTVPWRNGASFTLPNSGLLVSHTTTFVTLSYSPGGAVAPDVFLAPCSHDEFTRHDPVLAAALADSTSDSPPEASSITVVNGASFRRGAPVAPGSLPSAFGDFDGASGEAEAVPLPVRLGETQLLVNEVPAPLLAVRPTQINFQVPAATPVGIVPLRVVRSGNTIASGVMRVSATGPGLFCANLLNPARPGSILNQDDRINSDASPARPGEYVQIYATGQGATIPEAPDGGPGPAGQLARSVVEPRVYIGTAPAEVQFSGLSPAFTGLWQLNVRVPPGLDPGQYPVFVVMGAAVSDVVTLWIDTPQAPVAPVP